MNVDRVNSEIEMLNTNVSNLLEQKEIILDSLERLCKTEAQIIANFKESDMNNQEIIEVLKQDIISAENIADRQKAVDSYTNFMRIKIESFRSEAEYEIGRGELELKKRSLDLQEKDLYNEHDSSSGSLSFGQ